MADLSSQQQMHGTGNNNAQQPGQTMPPFVAGFLGMVRPTKTPCSFLLRAAEVLEIRVKTRRAITPK